MPKPLSMFGSCVKISHVLTSLLFILVDFKYFIDCLILSDQFTIWSALLPSLCGSKFPSGLISLPLNNFL